MPNQLKAGQVKLNAVALVTSSGTEINVLDHIIEVELNEDIDKHMMVGRIKMSEYLNLVEALPIIGEEFVRLDYEVFNEPDSQRQIDMRVSQVKNITKPKDKQFIYELILISPEYYTNNQISIDHAATKKVEIIINDILTKHTNTAKKYRAEATKSIQHIVFPGMSLRDAIKYCTFRAESANYPDSLFKFYETASGFNFLSLGKMISNEPKLTINYFQQNIQTDDDVNLAAFSAYSYNIITKNDTARALINGGYKNTLLVFDPLLKKKEYKELDYFNDFDQLANVDKKKTSTNYFRDIVAIQGSIDYAIIGNLRKRRRTTSVDNSDIYPEGYKSFFLNRQMSRARLNDLVIEIDIPITHFVEAGDKISFEVPNDSGVGDGSSEDEYVSGNYIVTSLKHVFSGEKGVTTLICKKSGFQTDIKRKD